MDREISLDLSKGELLLDKKTLRAAKIGKRVRLVIRDHSILIVADDSRKRRQSAADRSFGMVKNLPLKLVHKIAMSKDLENDL